jgi:hypothetical protein
MLATLDHEQIAVKRVVVLAEEHAPGRTLA